jgi:hypothetical protein
LAETPHPPPPAFGLISEGSIGHPRQTTSLCNPLAGIKPLPHLYPVFRIILDFFFVQ